MGDHWIDLHHPKIEPSPPIFESPSVYFNLSVASFDIPYDGFLEVFVDDDSQPDRRNTTVPFYLLDLANGL